MCLEKPSRLPAGSQSSLSSPPEESQAASARRHRPCPAPHASPSLPRAAAGEEEVGMAGKEVLGTMSARRRLWSDLCGSRGAVVCRIERDSGAEGRRAGWSRASRKEAGMSALKRWMCSSVSFLLLVKRRWDRNVDVSPDPAVAAACEAGARICPCFCARAIRSAAMRGSRKGSGGVVFFNFSRNRSQTGRFGRSTFIRGCRASRRWFSRVR
ncbi:hypothetical protein QBC33DRAFT_545750 [Phialemonium atrogriseum]|uniref:Uncharacterized protein n=1 Tax=Phialemonium atrogriseum TaxID=1093897 RepID=A0AAJ0BVM6_9PEZI|nr:uncharacterized protein QBC33DRAFT_545750 [Phialemonium atrogriseum]KAK1765106.1 hypothetical protein QBC33DRAFT_545750 [Phialemonium atrogriseum]